MWLWDPSPQLSDPAVRAQFFEFLARERIRRVWAQVGTEPQPAAAAQPKPAGQPTVSRRQLTRREEWRALLADAHNRGVRIEALDGDPAWALAVRHHEPLGIVEAILAFNRESPSTSQFDGIHLDIEPYLLFPWRFRMARQSLLREYLNLITRIQERAYEFPGMQVGVDIPSWWQATDDRTGRAIGDVEFGGVRKAASYHLIDRLDNVGIMNYRNFAEGPDGLISHGDDLLTYADRARHAKIWMGVETSRSTPTPVWFVVGLPSETVDALLEQGSTGIGRDNRFDGHRVRLFDDDLNTHVGLALTPGELEHPSPAVRAALADLARRLGVMSKPGPSDRGDLARNRALRAIAGDREWQEPVARPIVDPVSGAEYPGVLATAIMLPKLTFAGLSPEVMRRETAIAEAAFAAHASYTGLAIHHYESYLALVGPATAARTGRRLAWPFQRYGSIGTR